MIFRTIRTYFTLIFGVITQCHYAKNAAKISEEKGECEGHAFMFEKAAQIIKKTLKNAETEIIVEGLENIPKDQNFVLVSNHQSMVDIFAIVETIGRPVAFISKIELEKVPVLKTWMNAVGCVFMNRSDLRESMKALMEGIKKVKAGNCMGIFPEGTRTDGKMLEFKGGSFKLATKSGAPILPLTIDGTHKVLEDNHFFIKKATVRLTYHPLVDVKNLTKEEEKELPQKIQGIIGSALKEDERFVKD